MAVITNRVNKVWKESEVRLWARVGYSEDICLLPLLPRNQLVWDWSLETSKQVLSCRDCELKIIS